MQETKRSFEQDSSLQEQFEQELQIRNGGRISGSEGGLRLDIFDPDAVSDQNFSDDDCPVCELPEHAQNHIIEDIEYEESNAQADV